MVCKFCGKEIIKGEYFNKYYFIIEGETVCNDSDCISGIIKEKTYYFLDGLIKYLDETKRPESNIQRSFEVRIDIQEAIV